MGAVGGILGLAGGVNGTGVQGPQSANIVNPVTQDQLTSANSGVQNSMQGQQSLLAALQGQNGLGNQNQVYGQLQGVVNGTGPNPAQAQLAQATGQNVANQAALMAGQRGAGTNVGLMARQAGQQGGALQQNAVGQAATLQANQSLNALNSAGAMAGNMASNQIAQTNANTQTQQAYQQNLFNAQAGVNSANVANQASLNSANSQAASGMTGILGSAIGGAAQGGAKALAGGAAQGGIIMPGGIVGPQSKLAQHIMGRSSQAMAGGGLVDVILSPGEKKLTPEQAQMVAQGQANPMAMGETVPGDAPIKGAKNDYSNDIVPDRVPAGTVIVPRSETQSEDPDRNSARFVQSVVAKRKMGK